jgi:hypothetical protein
LPRRRFRRCRHSDMVAPIDCSGVAFADKRVRLPRPAGRTVTPTDHRQAVTPVEPHLEVRPPPPSQPLDPLPAPPEPAPQPNSGPGPEIPGGYPPPAPPYPDFPDGDPEDVDGTADGAPRDSDTGSFDPARAAAGLVVAAGMAMAVAALTAEGERRAGLVRDGAGHHPGEDHVVEAGPPLDPVRQEERLPGACRRPAPNRGARPEAGITIVIGACNCPYW